MFPILSLFLLHLSLSLFLAPIHGVYDSTVRDPVVITIVYERWDSIASSYIANLNASLLYYRDYYGLDDEVLVLENRQLPRNFTTKSYLDSLRRHSALLISLIHTTPAKQELKEFARLSSIPTIQTRLSPWTGISNDTLNFNSSLDNFVQLIPSFVVFDNILKELVQFLNISTELLVLYDQHFDENVAYDWRTPFNALPVSVHFEPMFSELSVASMHIKQLEVGAKNIFLLASTELVQLYIQAAIPQFEARHFRRFVVFTKDSLALKCEDCLSADLFWVRMMPNGRVETLRKFNDFLRQEELDVDMSYQVPVPTYAETQVSFCLDIIQIAAEFLLLTNQELAKLAKKRPRGLVEEWGHNHIGEENNGTERRVTLKRLIQRAEQDYEYGHYELHYGEMYFQALTGMILKVERRVDEPDVDYHKYIANWTLERGIHPLYGSLGVDVRQLNHLRIVTIIQEPFVQFASENGNKRQSVGMERPRPCASQEPVRLDTGQLVEGYCVDLLRMLTKALNFTYELYLVEDGKFGSVDENGNWDGMIGDLVLGKAEMALGPISVLAERENDIDFTVPFYDLVGLSILMRRSDVEYSMFKFLKVLEWPVWTCILGAYLFTSTLLWVFDRFSPYSYRNNSEKYVDDIEKRKFTLKECLWFCMTSLTPQGGGEAPKNVSGRLVAATWWLFGFIIIASYTANLAAFLTVSRMEQTISGLDDLAKQYKIEYAPLKGGATETYFRRMAEIEEQFYSIWKQMSLNESMETRDRAKLAVWDYPVSDKFTNMWRFMQESKLPRTVEEAVDRVLDSEKGYAFIGDAMEIKYAILINCRLQQVGSEFSRKPYAIAVQTDHVLKEPLSQSILRLQNERKLETCKERWWHQNERRKDCPNAEDDSSGISIQNIGGVFIVILAGIGISMVMLLFEYIYYTRRRAAAEDKMVVEEAGGAGGAENGRQSREQCRRGSEGVMVPWGGAREYVQHRHQHQQAHSNPAFNVD